MAGRRFEDIVNVMTQDHYDMRELINKWSEMLSPKAATVVFRFFDGNEYSIPNFTKIREGGLGDVYIKRSPVRKEGVTHNPVSNPNSEIILGTQPSTGPRNVVSSGGMVSYCNGGWRPKLGVGVGNNDFYTAGTLVDNDRSNGLFGLTRGNVFGNTYPENRWREQSSGRWERVKYLYIDKADDRGNTYGSIEEEAKDIDGSAFVRDGGVGGGVGETDLWGLDADRVMGERFEITGTPFFNRFNGHFGDEITIGTQSSRRGEGVPGTWISCDNIRIQGMWEPSKPWAQLSHDGIMGKNVQNVEWQYGITESNYLKAQIIASGLNPGGSSVNPCNTKFENVNTLNSLQLHVMNVQLVRATTGLWNIASPGCVMIYRSDDSQFAWESPNIDATDDSTSYTFKGNWVGSTSSFTTSLSTSNTVLRMSLLPMFHNTKEFAVVGASYAYCRHDTHYTQLPLKFAVVEDNMGIGLYLMHDQIERDSNNSDFYSALAPYFNKTSGMSDASIIITYVSYQ